MTDASANICFGLEVRSSYLITKPLKVDVTFGPAQLETFMGQFCVSPL